MCKQYLKNLILKTTLITGSLVIAVATTSCGPAGTPYISPTLIKHVKLFEDTYSIKVDFDVVVADLDIEYVGMCTIWSDGSKKIEISAKYIDVMHPSLVEETVLHELGHCILNREHEDSFIHMRGSWIPRSIMFSFVHPSHEKYEQNKDWYLNELIFH